MSVVYFILLLGGLIFFHELGHYVMARLLGVHVVTFSIGFGPTLLSWRSRGTDYRLAALPLGGYVKLLGDDPGEEVPEGLNSRAFMEQTLWRRFLIIFGGPLFNLILPFLVFFILGLTTPRLSPAVVGSAAPDGPAYKAGLRSGDHIVEVDGHETRYWWQLVDVVAKRPGREVPVTYERDGKQHKTRLTPAAVDVVRIRELGVTDRVGRIEVALLYARPIIRVEADSPAWTAGLRTGDRLLAVGGRKVERWSEVDRFLKSSPGAFDFVALRGEKTSGTGGATPAVLLDIAGEPVSGRVEPGPGGSTGIATAEFVVTSVEKDTPAATAGLKPGDEILSVDGRRFASWPYLRQVLDNGGTAGRSLQVRRGAEVLELPLALVEESRKTEINTEIKVLIFGAFNSSHYDYVASIPNEDRLAYGLHRMVADSMDAMRLTVLGIAGLFAGQVSFKDMGGPILVYNLASATEGRGWEYFFRIMVILSINLGLINLFPIPVLDGGHIMFIAIEAVRRKPISLRVRQGATYVGLGLILMLMILVFRNDIERNWDSISRFLGG
jgi:regulator of sigma E protease